MKLECGHDVRYVAADPEAPTRKDMARGWDRLPEWTAIIDTEVPEIVAYVDSKETARLFLLALAGSHTVK